MLIDAHSHIDRYNLIGRGALAAALEEITQHQIFTISNTMGLPSYQHTLELSQRCPWILPTFGVHPWTAPEVVDHLTELDAAIAQSPMLGEIGLDYYFVNAATYSDQRKVFEYFLGAAREQKKLLNLHTKGAEEDVLKLLDRYDCHRAIIHWYSGPLDIFQEYVTEGFYFTVGVEVLHTDAIRTLAQKIPSNRLLTETDNPGGIKSFTNQPGMPVLIKEVVQAVAETRGATAEAIIHTVHTNWLELIHDDPWLAGVSARLPEP